MLFKPKNIMFTVIGLFIALTLLSTPVLAGNKTVLYKGKVENIWLRTTKFNKAEDGFSHPCTLSQNQIEALLSKINFQASKFVSFDYTNPQPVFDARQRALLANYIVEGLAKAGNNQYVDFELTTPERSFKRYTKGSLFVRDNALNIVFDRIREPGANKAVDQFERGDGHWKIVLNDSTQSFQPRSIGDSLRKNWLIISMTQPEPVKKTQAGKKAR